MIHRLGLPTFILWMALLVEVAFAQGDVTIEGNRFFRDGQPWVAEGVTLVGLVAPESILEDKPAYANARKKFGAQMLQEVKAYGADLVRYQVSLGALDPQSPIYNIDYRDEVLDGIRQSREAGLNVIVSMQWQEVSGTVGESGMPSAGANRAWLQIIDAIANDLGTLLEVFNEPHLRERTPEAWEIWRSGMQGLIYLLRGAGSQNVLLIDGLRSAHYLGGAPDLVDPLNQTGYAVHPYLTSINKTRAQWDKNFGDFSQTKPVIATEFMANSRSACTDKLPQQTERLLNYLKNKDIGMTVWALDLGVVKRGKDLSHFENFKCGANEIGGAGKMIHDYYLSK